MRYSVLLLVGALLLVLTAPVFALDPVDPSHEGYGITSSVSLHVDGDMTHNEDFDHEECEGTITITVDGDDVYSAPLQHGQIRYTDENSAYDGTTDMEKSLSATTDPDVGHPNLEVSKDVSYVTSGKPTGVYIADEKGEVRLLNTSSDIQENVEGDNICILADESERDTALGSAINATLVAAHTDTGLNLMGGDVTAAHSIEASGHGMVRADMITLYREHVWHVIYDGGCDEAGTDVPGLGGAEMTYKTSAVAEGTISNFSKSMSTRYPVEVTAAQPGGLPGLCPWSDRLNQHQCQLPGLCNWYNR